MPAVLVSMNWNKPLVPAVTVPINCHWLMGWLRLVDAHSRFVLPGKDASSRSFGPAAQLLTLLTP